MLDVLYVRVGSRIDMRGETAAAGKFVVYLLFEENHLFASELVQNVKNPGAAEEGGEATMEVGEILGTA